MVWLHTTEFGTATGLVDIALVGSNAMDIRMVLPRVVDMREMIMRQAVESIINLRVKVIWRRRIGYLR